MPCGQRKCFVSNALVLPLYTAVCAWTEAPMPHRSAISARTDIACLFVVGRKEQRRFADERAFWHPKLIFIENFSCCEGSHCKPDTETHIYGVSGGAESGELAGYRQFLPGFGGILPDRKS